MAPSTIPSALSIYILTFNCATHPISASALSTQLFSNLTPSSPSPSLLILNLQELAPIPSSLIGGSFLVPYFQNFYTAINLASKSLSQPTKYVPIAARNLGMTGIIVFVKEEERECVRDIEIAGTGTGMWEMGNKGAVGVRFRFVREEDGGAGGEETELTFVSAHLAAFEDGLERRNEDWKSICRRLVFASSTASELVQKGGGGGDEATDLIGEEGEEARALLSVEPRNAGIFKPTSHLFFAGDLNYRTSIISPSPTDHEDTFPQPHHESQDPRHWSKLFESDQLTRERKAGRTLNGLVEERVDFPPTYKYKDGDGEIRDEQGRVEQWNWAKHRWPSWCDRILYLPFPSWVPQPEGKTRSKSATKYEIKTGKYDSLPLMQSSDHRGVTLEVSVPLVPIPVPPEGLEDADPRISPPWDIDIDWKAKRQRARRLEVLVGFILYFTTTREGGAVAVGMGVGVIGAVFVLKAWWGV